MSQNGVQPSLVTIDWNAVPLPSITYKGQSLIEAASARLVLKVSPSGIELSEDLKALIQDLLSAIAAVPSTQGRRKVLLADAIFGNLFIEQFPPNPKLKSQYWRAILDFVWDWELKNGPVHKGSPYFFMAESFLQSGDIPSAYICIFNAIEEDKQNAPKIPKDFKDSPAYMTASLVDDSDNRLHSTVVIPLRKSIELFLSDYNLHTGGKFTMNSLDTKFLQKDELENIKRFFVANFHETYHLAPMNSTRMINNDYSKLKIVDTLFNFGLVVDQILAHKFLQKISPEKWSMAKGVYQLALHLNWTSIKVDKDPGEFLKKLNPKLNDTTPDQVLPDLLNGKGTYEGKSMDPRMSAIAAAYHLRNYAGHHLEGSDVLVKRYNDVLGLIMNAFFAAVEIL